METRVDGVEAHLNAKANDAAASLVILNLEIGDAELLLASDRRITGFLLYEFGSLRPRCSFHLFG